MGRRPALYAVLFLLAMTVAAAQPAWATLPSPNQPILVVQNSASTDPYQNFVPEMLTTEGLNGFQTAQLTDLTATFLAKYDVVILPHLTLTAAQVTLFQNYVSTGGTLVGFRPDLKLASVFGVASLGTTLSEGWLKIDTTTTYGSGLDATVMKFHGVADLYTLSGATSLATLYNNSTTPTVSPAAAVYALGTGKAVLFSFDLTQSNVLMRQGNPAWAGAPNTHDGYNTLRASQMFMDKETTQYWNDLGDGALNDVPQADIQLRLFSNAVTLTNAAKRPLPRLWYFPNQSRSMLLMTADEHAFNNDLSGAISELNAVQTAGGKDSIFFWYPYGLISNTQANSWISAGHAVGIHFDDTSETDSSGVGGSGASWNGMQSVIANALSSFASTYPTAPTPVTTRDHFLIWVSQNAAGNPDQTAQAKLLQTAGVQLDTSYMAFPNRWGYMSGTGLPMKFLDTTTGSVISVYEQPGQYEDDVQLGTAGYSTQWNFSTAQTHYQKTLSDSLSKYNTVVTMLFHPDSWSGYSSYAQTVLQYAQTNSIPTYSTAAWLQFWKARAATAVSLPTFALNTLTFTATGAPAGLTLIVPRNSGTRAISALSVDGVGQTLSIATYQGVQYASTVLSAGSHSISATYAALGSIVISGTITPAASGTGATVTLSGTASGTTTADSSGNYSFTVTSNGSYTVTPAKTGYTFSPTNRAVTVNGANVTGVNFTATAIPTFSISGSLTTTASGATVTLTGAASATTTADSSGNFTFTGLLNGSYTVTPTKMGYAFTPTSRAVTVSGANVTGVNFTPTVLPTYSLSGNVSANGSGATVTLSGAASATATADASGNYSFTGLFTGGYTVTPTKSGYSFSPANAAVTVNNANVTGVNFTATVLPATQTLLTTQTPEGVNFSDGAGINYELGMAFSSTVAGQITGVRFWKTSNESGTHTGRIWSSTGTQLASVVFSGETASGWQQQLLTTPLTINAGTTYVVTVNTGNTYYVASSGGFATPIVSGNLQSVVGNNGVYGSPATFPTNSWQSANYFRDVMFVPGASYSVSGNVSTNGSGAAVAISGTSSATTTADSSGNFSFAALPNGSYTVTPTKTGYVFTPASAAATINGANVTGVNFTATAVPTYSISGNTSTTGSGATVTLSGATSATATADASGNYTFTGLLNGSYTVTPSKSGYNFTPANAPVTVSGANVTGVNFTATAFSGTQTLLTTQTPAGTNFSDGAGVNYELGMAFTSTAAGQITGVRFWKSANESGTHTGRIWSSTGTLLASVTFTGETASGWQQQLLTTPLTISANTTYVVSVNTGNTFYVASNSGFATQIVSGNLQSVVGNNGIYGAPGTFPTNSWQSSNYFRDVMFVAGP